MAASPKLSELNESLSVSHLHDYVTLGALILVALVPMVSFAAAIVLNLGRAQRMSVEQGLLTTVRALAIAVEREVAASIRALEVLATSELLRRDDLAAFHAQATRAVNAQNVWYVLALTDPSGQLLLNTVRPFGASLPRIEDRDYFRRLTATGRPAVSDLVAGRTTGQLNVTVAVPVLRDGTLRYVLFAAIKPEGFGQILADEDIPGDWIATISDTRQVIVARNRNPARFVGQELIAPLRQAVRVAEEGAGRYPVFDSPEYRDAVGRRTREVVGSFTPQDWETRAPGRGRHDPGGRRLRDRRVRAVSRTRPGARTAA